MEIKPKSKDYALNYFAFQKLNLCMNDGPEARSGHRIVTNGDTILSIGGYNPKFWNVDNDDESYYPLFRELWQFNLSSYEWKRLNSEGYMPVELASHTVLLINNHTLLVYGGTGIPFGEAASCKLYVCDMRTLHWRLLTCSGTAPTRTYGHTMTLYENCLYIFGGTTGYEYNADIHRLDLATLEWSQVAATGTVPEGRYRHEVACFADKLFVFGGGRANEAYGFEELPVFDLKLCRWDYRMCQPDNQHKYPAPRRCHSCVQLDNAALICGGYDGHVIFDDLWRFDLEKYQWSRLTVAMPEPAYFHSATITEAGRMVIFGGVTRIDSVRTESVYSMWVRVASLRDLCWHTVSSLLRHNDALSPTILRSLSIPSTLIERVV